MKRSHARQRLDICHHQPASTAPPGSRPFSSSMFPGGVAANDRFQGVTNLCYRNGAATWPECSGGGVRSRGGLGASQSSGPLIEKFYLPEGWLGGGSFPARRNEHTSGTEGRLTRNGGGKGSARWKQIPSNGTIWNTAKINGRFDRFPLKHFRFGCLFHSVLVVL